MLGVKSHKYINDSSTNFHPMFNKSIQRGHINALFKKYDTTRYNPGIWLPFSRGTLPIDRNLHGIQWSPSGRILWRRRKGLTSCNILGHGNVYMIYIYIYEISTIYNIYCTISFEGIPILRGMGVQCSFSRGEYFTILGHQLVKYIT